MLVVPKKGTKAHLTARINAQLLERLLLYAQERGRTKSEIVDRAIEEFLDRQAPPAPPKSSKPAK